VNEDSIGGGLRLLLLLFLWEDFVADDDWDDDWDESDGEDDLFKYTRSDFLKNKVMY
jgi:hypothetical protein